MKKLYSYKFLFLSVFLSVFELSAQNKQNKYYKPIRFSIDGFTKIPISSESFDYSGGYGGNFGIVYTLNKTASLELSFRTGYALLTNSKKKTSLNSIPISLGVDFYFYDKDFSPYVGVHPGINFMDNSIEPSLLGQIGVSYKQMKIYGGYKYMEVGSVIEIGIGYFFRQRPCGCFPFTE